jgi:hypothetical protein
MDRATQDRLERRLAKLEQDARSGRPVNVTQPKKSDEFIILAPYLKTMAGASSTGWSDTTPSGAPGRVFLPQGGLIATKVPSNYESSIQIVMSQHINRVPVNQTYFLCSDDVLAAGNTITVRYAMLGLAGNDFARVFTPFTLTKRSASPLGGTGIFWKGAFLHELLYPGTDYLEGLYTPAKITGRKENITLISYGPGSQVILAGDQTAVAAPGVELTITGTGGPADASYVVESSNLIAGNTTVLLTTVVPTSGTGGTASVGTDILFMDDTYEIRSFVPALDPCPWATYSQEDLAFRLAAFPAYNIFNYNHHFSKGNRPVTVQPWGGMPAVLPCRIPDAMIPPGVWIWEPENTAGNSLRIRYKHPITREMYEGNIPLVYAEGGGAASNGDHVGLTMPTYEGIIVYLGNYHPSKTRKTTWTYTQYNK